MKNICFQMSRKVWLAAILTLCFSFPALAQKITVSGTVIDPEGEPLIGASVMVKGETLGTATNIDGEYSLSVAPDATLVFSYVGYATQEIPVNGQSSINVTMDVNSEVLGEVVAIGYGTVKKSDATGSVAVVKPDEIEAGLATSVQDMLVGQTPGVVVTTAGGPEGSGTIRIRGGSSLNASNDPLIVVDGVPLSNDGVQGMGNSLSMIAPDNIETMTILKDASATAIYGSRASNGVIIITTKKGIKGAPEVTFSANMYVNKAQKRWDVLDANSFRAMMTSVYGAGSNEVRALGNANTDWQDEVLRTTVSSDYNLSVRGSAGVLPYRVSVTYTNSNGILKTSKMDRLTFGFNLNPKFFDDHLSVSANAKGYYFNNRFANTGAIGGALSYNPTAPVYDIQRLAGDSGQKYLFNGYTSWYNISDKDNSVSLNPNAAVNPVAQLMDVNNHAKVLRSNGNLQLDYSFHFLPELHANLNLGYDITKTDEYNEVMQNSPQAWLNHRKNGAGYEEYTYQSRSNTLLDFYLNYKKDFESIKSMLDVTAGYSWQRFSAHGRNWGASSEKGRPVTPGFKTISSDNGTFVMDVDPKSISAVGTNYVEDPNSGNGNYRWRNHLQLLSFFGRVNYGFMDRYLLTVTVRGDATSRFSKDNRWGIFPSVALAWKISEENFLESTRGWLNDWKLRLGWGVTGQQEVGGTVNYLPQYSIAQPGSYYPSGQLDANGKPIYVAPLYLQGYNPDLKWESTTTWNAGMDWGFMNNRITASLDYYYRKTKDLLSFVAIPAGSSTTNMLNRNIGSLVNYGIEFNIQARPVVTDDFTWTVSYNVGWNHNKITELYDGSTIRTGGIAGGNGNTVQAHAVGHAANTFYLYQQVYDQAGNPIEGAYVDQNGDGQIDDADKILNKSPDPKVTMTLGNNFRYKNWDLGINLRASLGNYVYNNVLSNNINTSTLYSSYGINNVVDNDVYFSQPQYMSDYFLRNGSFLRCENITLGYTWDNLLNEKLRLRLFAAVQNPFIITKYKGIDPEVFGGIDNSVYPKARIYTLGVVATF